ncbi:Gfo/Idh/MocA family protein [Planosporangium mesophilum]|uniref:Oxidoreductase n=1 Tax=Planosporangium mesophilum TaxID=689768 RepID=A0A8J3TAP8_9ACTN|nr:Gfo/Idh/MocA family oxidoreductase [Planosporangium mesophilum]NJC80969.1 Gfo/Idh/MocA family oxidoreductase [Planosporangium mesophilum]GII21389.1 oxidoreductase [Planosporangium mesophilum]
MSDPIRWGILATGAIARAFVADLSLVPDAEVAAVGSRSQEAADRFAAARGIPRAYGSWQDLASDPDIDVVYVATPHSAHYAAALTCLRAGKAVLCEKPLTLNLAQAEELVETARAAGVFLMEAMWMRCIPAIHTLCGLIADGAIGEVTAVHADFGIADPVEATHRLRAPELGGGALLDLGVYPVTFAHLILGAPDHVEGWARLSPEGVDENTGMTFGYASGALASLTCSLVGDSARTATVTGTRGRVELPRDFYRAAGFTLVRGEAAPEYIPVPFDGLGYHFEAAEVQRCLREGLTESPVVPLAETLAVMSTLDAVRDRIGVEYPA